MPSTRSCLFGWGYFSLILGCILLAFGIFLHHFIEVKFKPGILNADIVTSTRSENYPRWVSNHFEGAPILYNGFYMYNMTNFDEFLANGAIPQYQEVGPYLYREQHDRVGVSWSEDETEVTCWDYVHYIFDPSVSSGDPLKDVIYNVNPAYVGAIAQAKSDAALTVGFTSFVMRDFMDFFTGEFVQQVALNASASVLRQAQVDLGGNADAFYFQWANSTADATPSWNGMRVSSNLTGQSGISLASAQKLFDWNLANSLTNSDGYSVLPWKYALQGDVGNQTSLKQQFGLTDRQLALVLKWWGGEFVQLWVYPNLTETWAVQQPQDIGWLQWGTGVVTNQVSVQTLFPGKNFLLPPELPLWWYSKEPVFDVTLGIAQSKILFNGSYGLFNLLNVASFFDVLAARNWTAMEQMWGLSELDTTKFAPYFLNAADVVSTAKLESIFAKGGGFIAKRTVHQWLWNAIDPLLQIIQPASANVRLQTNYTSAEDAMANSNSSTYNTGKLDSTQIMKFKVWKGVTQVNFFSQVQIVNGTSEDGQFQPFLEPYTPITTWNALYLRTLHLIPMGEVQVQGVYAQRYELANTTLMVNPDFDQSIRGFANLTGFKRAPIFLGNSHMWLAEEKWATKIKGMKNSSYSDATKVDIEPFTGKVIQVNRSLQVNIYVETSLPYIAYNPNVQADTMYPIMWAFETTQITAPLAKQLVNSLYRTRQIKSLLLPLCIPIGTVLIFLGLFWAVFMGHMGYRFKKTHVSSSYHRINTE